MVVEEDFPTILSMFLEHGDNPDIVDESGSSGEHKCILGLLDLSLDLARYETYKYTLKTIMLVAPLT